MNKPIIVVKEELKRDIVNSINNSGLPAFIVEYILRDLLSEASVLAKQQYQKELELYNASLENDSDKSSK